MTDMAPPNRPEGHDAATAPEIPAGTDLYVYWCPKCNRQISGPWHTIKGNPMFPQTDDEHYGVRVDVVPV